MRPTVNYSASFTRNFRNDPTQRYSISELLLLSKSPIVKDQEKLVESEVEPVNAAISRKKPTSNSNPTVTSSSSSRNNNNRNHSRHGSGNHALEGDHKPPTRQYNSRPAEPPGMSMKAFDMEEFKREMRRRDGIESPPEPESHSTSVINSIFSTTPSASGNTVIANSFAARKLSSEEPDFEKAASLVNEVGSVTSKKSRFGGRFFRLDDDVDESTASSLATGYSSSIRSTPDRDVFEGGQEISPAGQTVIPTSLNASPVNNVQSVASVSPSSNITPVDNVTKRSLLPKKPLVSFDPGVPTSVMRKMSGNSVDFKLKSSSSPVPKKATTSPPQTQTPSVPSMLPGMNNNNNIMPSNGHAVIDGTKPIIHIEPDGRRIELPPPQTFVQMLLANNLPVPPEMMQFVPNNNIMMQQQPIQPQTMHQQDLLQHLRPPPSSEQPTNGNGEENILTKFFGKIPSPVEGQIQSGTVHSLADIEKTMK